MESEKFGGVGAQQQQMYPSAPPIQAVTYASPTAGHVLDENDPRWRCCCNAIHVRTGAYVLAVAELVLGGLGLSYATFGRNTGGSTTKGGSVANILLTFIVCGLMLYGLRTSKRFFLVPHLIYQILAIIGLLIVAVLLVAAAAVVASIGSVHDRNHRVLEDVEPEVARGILIALAIIFAGISALEIWFFAVVLRAFRYLREVEGAQSYGSPMVSYGGHNPGVN